MVEVVPHRSEIRADLTLVLGQGGDDAEVGPGGHHLGTAHTQARYKSAFFPPTLADRRGHDAWLAAGAEDATRRANRAWKAMLAAYEPPPLDVAIAEALDDYVARRERELIGATLYE